MGEEKVVFNDTIENMFVRGLGPHLSPNARSRLKGIGIDLDRRLLPSYSFETWMESLRIAVDELFPSRPREEAMQRLGEILVEGYRHTAMGSTMLSMARLLGPKRTLVRAAQSFRAGNNYTETKLTEVNPNCYELWMNEVGPYPSFSAGIVLAGLRAANARDPRVEVLDHDGHACTFRVTFDGMLAG